MASDSLWFTRFEYPIKQNVTLQDGTAYDSQFLIPDSELLKLDISKSRGLDKVGRSAVDAGAPGVGVGDDAPLLPLSEFQRTFYWYRVPFEIYSDRGWLLNPVPGLDRESASVSASSPVARMHHKQVVPERAPFNLRAPIESAKRSSAGRFYCLTRRQTNPEGYSEADPRNYVPIAAFSLYVVDVHEHRIVLEGDRVVVRPPLQPVVSDLGEVDELVGGENRYRWVFYRQPSIASESNTLRMINSDLDALDQYLRQNLPAAKRPWLRVPAQAKQISLLLLGLRLTHNLEFAFADGQLLDQTPYYQVERNMVYSSLETIRHMLSIGYEQLLQDVTKEERLAFADQLLEDLIMSYAVPDDVPVRVIYSDAFLPVIDVPAVHAGSHDGLWVCHALVARSEYPIRKKHPNLEEGYGLTWRRVLRLQLDILSEAAVYDTKSANAVPSGSAYSIEAATPSVQLVRHVAPSVTADNNDASPLSLRLRNVPVRFDHLPQKYEIFWHMELLPQGTVSFNQRVPHDPIMDKSYARSLIKALNQQFADPLSVFVPFGRRIDTNAADGQDTEVFALESEANIAATVAGEWRTFVGNLETIQQSASDRINSGAIGILKKVVSGNLQLPPATLIVAAFLHKVNNSAGPSQGLSHLLEHLFGNRLILPLAKDASPMFTSPKRVREFADRADANAARLKPTLEIIALRIETLYNTAVSENALQASQLDQTDGLRPLLGLFVIDVGGAPLVRPSPRRQTAASSPIGDLITGLGISKETAAAQRARLLLESNIALASPLIDQLIEGRKRAARLFDTLSNRDSIVQRELTDRQLVAVSYGPPEALHNQRGLDSAYVLNGDMINAKINDTSNVVMLTPLASGEGFPVFVNDSVYERGTADFQRWLVNSFLKYSQASRARGVGYEPEADRIKIARLFLNEPGNERAFVGLLDLFEQQRDIKRRVLLLRDFRLQRQSLAVFAASSILNAMQDEPFQLICNTLVRHPELVPGETEAERQHRKTVGAMLLGKLTRLGVLLGREDYTSGEPIGYADRSVPPTGGSYASEQDRTTLIHQASRKFDPSLYISMAPIDAIESTIKKLPLRKTLSEQDREFLRQFFIVNLPPGVLVPNTDYKPRLVMPRRVLEALSVVAPAEPPVRAGPAFPVVFGAGKFEGAPVKSDPRFTRPEFTTPRPVASVPKKDGNLATIPVKSGGDDDDDDDDKGLFDDKATDDPVVAKLSQSLEGLALEVIPEERQVGPARLLRGLVSQNVFGSLLPSRASESALAPAPGFAPASATSPPKGKTTASTSALAPAPGPASASNVSPSRGETTASVPILTPQALKRFHSAVINFTIGSFGELIRSYKAHVDAMKRQRAAIEWLEKMFVGKDPESRSRVDYMIGLFQTQYNMTAVSLEVTRKSSLTTFPTYETLIKRPTTEENAPVQLKGIHKAVADQVLHKLGKNHALLEKKPYHESVDKALKAAWSFVFKEVSRDLDIGYDFIRTRLRLEDSLFNLEDGSSLVLATRPEQILALKEFCLARVRYEQEADRIVDPKTKQVPFGNKKLYHNIVQQFAQQPGIDQLLQEISDLRDGPIPSAIQMQVVTRLRGIAIDISKDRSVYSNAKSVLQDVESRITEKLYNTLLARASQKGFHPLSLWEVSRDVLAEKFEKESSNIRAFGTTADSFVDLISKARQDINKVRSLIEEAKSLESAPKVASAATAVATPEPVSAAVQVKDPVLVQTLAKALDTVHNGLLSLMLGVTDAPLDVLLLSKVRNRSQVEGVRKVLDAATWTNERASAADVSRLEAELHRYLRALLADDGIQDEIERGIAFSVESDRLLFEQIYSISSSDANVWLSGDFLARSTRVLERSGDDFLLLLSLAVESQIGAAQNTPSWRGSVDPSVHENLLQEYEQRSKEVAEHLVSVQALFRNTIAWIARRRFSVAKSLFADAVNSDNALKQQDYKELLARLAATKERFAPIVVESSEEIVKKWSEFYTALDRISNNCHRHLPAHRDQTPNAFRAVQVNPRPWGVCALETFCRITEGDAFQDNFFQRAKALYDAKKRRDAVSANSLFSLSPGASAGGADRREQQIENLYSGFMEFWSEIQEDVKARRLPFSSIAAFISVRFLDSDAVNKLGALLDRTLPRQGQFKASKGASSAQWAPETRALVKRGCNVWINAIMAARTKATRDVLLPELDATDPGINHSERLLVIMDMYTRVLGKTHAAISQKLSVGSLQSGAGMQTSIPEDQLREMVIGSGLQEPPRLELIQRGLQAFVQELYRQSREFSVVRIRNYLNEILPQAAALDDLARNNLSYEILDTVRQASIKAFDSCFAPLRLKEASDASGAEPQSRDLSEEFVSTTLQLFNVANSLAPPGTLSAVDLKRLFGTDAQPLKKEKAIQSLFGSVRRVMLKDSTGRWVMADGGDGGRWSLVSHEPPSTAQTAPSLDPSSIKSVTSLSVLRSDPTPLAAVIQDVNPEVVVHTGSLVIDVINTLLLHIDIGPDQEPLLPYLPAVPPPSRLASPLKGAPQSPSRVVESVAAPTTAALKPTAGADFIVRPAAAAATGTDAPAGASAVGTEPRSQQSPSLDNSSFLSSLEQLRTLHDQVLNIQSLWDVLVQDVHKKTATAFVDLLSVVSAYPDKQRLVLGSMKRELLPVQRGASVLGEEIDKLLRPQGFNNLSELSVTGPADVERLSSQITIGALNEIIVGVSSVVSASRALLSSFRDPRFQDTINDWIRAARREVGINEKAIEMVAQMRRKRQEYETAIMGANADRF